MADLITRKIEDNLALLTLTNPPVNALSQALLKELDGTLDDLASNADVRAVVITGSGNNAFCAGADVNELATLNPEQAAGVVASGHSVFLKISEFPKPIIAAVNNLCLGGGLELALSCDMRFSSDRARFGAPEVTLGLIPAWGGSQRLPRLIGISKAKELIFTGQMINAQEAMRVGLVNRVVPDGDEVRAAMDIAKRIAVKSSPLAVKEAKNAINKGMDVPLEDGLGLEAEAVQRISASDDLREGLTAFKEKRQPSFTGK